MIKSSKLFVAIALVLIVSGCLLLFSKEEIDINVHDTYFVFTWSHLLFFLSLIFLFKSLVYFGFEKLGKSINKLIGLLDALGLVSYLLLMFSAIICRSMPGRYYPNYDEDFTELLFEGLLSGGPWILIISQLIFIIGIPLALFAKRSKS